ncbi:hypothetical protein TrVE_jg7797 [Triparma verrucosa]|uniref:SAP domain-containing protein n=1 Tax=Triparma verrucosa TaxID=1606542 RepID=A0A9W7B6W6_9STRA|nr:hypothetical protein TrVE_jg7797 [Triparma verrucosa]
MPPTKPRNKKATPKTTKEATKATPKPTKKATPGKATKATPKMTKKATPRKAKKITPRKQEMGTRLSEAAEKSKPLSEELSKKELRRRCAEAEVAQYGNRKEMVARLSEAAEKSKPLSEELSKKELRRRCAEAEVAQYGNRQEMIERLKKAKKTTPRKQEMVARLSEVAEKSKPLSEELLLTELRRRCAEARVAQYGNKQEMVARLSEAAEKSKPLSEELSKKELKRRCAEAEVALYGTKQKMVERLETKGGTGDKRRAVASKGAVKRQKHDGGDSSKSAGKRPASASDEGAKCKMTALNPGQQQIIDNLVKQFQQDNHEKELLEEENALLHQELERKDSLLSEAQKRVEQLQDGSGINSNVAITSHQRQGIAEIRGYMKKEKYQKELVKLDLICLQPGTPSEGQHVFHIIANTNGGPDHTDNYLFALGGTFNMTIGNRFDHLNCYLAGKEKARRAVEICKATALDSSLHKWIEKRTKGKDRVLYTDSIHKFKSGETLFGEGQSLFTRSILSQGRADKSKTT